MAGQSCALERFLFRLETMRQVGLGWDVATGEVLSCPVWLLLRSPGVALWSQMKSEILP